MEVLVRKREEVSRMRRERTLKKAQSELEEKLWEKHWVRDKDKSKGLGSGHRRLGGGRRPRAFVIKPNGNGS